LALIEKDFGRNSTLNKEGVVSDLDREKSKGQLLQYQKSYNQTDQSLISNQIKSKQLELEIQRLTEERMVKVNDHIFKIKNIINDLRKNQRLWEETYIVKSKIDGIVSMKSDITIDRYIKPDLAIATIVPKLSSKEKYAQIVVPAASIGKITKGTAAIIRFDAFPYKEYGILKSKVRKIAMLPDQDKEGKIQYEIHLALKDKMISTYNYNLPYQPMASITADVITEDKSILSRIFEQFTDLLKNK
jgi:multidrug resistance efflux pump